MAVNDHGSKITLLVMDVDGTLTDGAMYYSAQGESLKRFSTRDGMAITLLNRAGIESVIMTSEQSEIAVKRANKLGIKEIILGTHDKCSSIVELAARRNIPFEAIAYIGDDVNDAHVMKLCGLTACPSDAVESIKEIVHYVCSASGGNGAVREFAELILRSQHKPVTLPEKW
ncbi:MAG: HAD family hydrolase [Ignavibacteria bacterium]|nr:HAD family hydrolase [Ignavibacteria bacterium]